MVHGRALGLSAGLLWLALAPRGALAQAPAALGPFVGMRDNCGSYPNGKVPAHRLFEVAFALQADYANPFSPYPANPAAPAPEQVDADGGKAETGDWSCVIEAVDAAGTARSEPRAFGAVESDEPGFIRAVPGSRFLRFENGAAFIPLGNNLVKTTDAGVIKAWAARAGSWAGCGTRAAASSRRSRRLCPARPCVCPPSSRAHTRHSLRTRGPAPLSARRRSSTPAARRRSTSPCSRATSRSRWSPSSRRA